MGNAKVIAVELMISEKGQTLVRLGCQRPGAEYLLWDSYHMHDHTEPLTVASWVGELYVAVLELLERATASID